VSRRPRKPARRHSEVALPLLAALLLGSGVLRFGMTDIAAATEAAGNALSGARQSPAEKSRNCTPAPDVAKLLAAIRHRAKDLDSREARLGDRMQALHVAERAADRKMAELVAAEKKLARTVAIADDAAEGDITRLTSVYENMKPKVAAKVFAAMKPDFAAGFLGRMSPEAAAGILSGLEPGVAYTISVILAGRNAAAPKE